MTLALMQQDGQGEDYIIAQVQSFHDMLINFWNDHILLPLSQQSHNLFYVTVISLPLK